MVRELDEVERRVLVALSKGPASTIWKLSNILGLAHVEVSAALEELSKSGLITVTPRGWELTPEAQEMPELFKKEPGGIRHSKKMVKFALPSDVERSKSIIKPFKKVSEESEAEEGGAG